MKTSNISVETESTSDTCSDTNHTKPKNSDDDENSDEIRDSFSHSKNLSLNYDDLSTEAYLKTQTNVSLSRSNGQRSFNNSCPKNKKNEKEIETEFKVNVFLCCKMLDYEFLLNLYVILCKFLLTIKSTFFQFLGSI